MIWSSTTVEVLQFVMTLQSAEEKNGLSMDWDCMSDVSPHILKCSKNSSCFSKLTLISDLDMMLWILPTLVVISEIGLRLLVYYRNWDVIYMNTWVTDNTRELQTLITWTPTTTHYITVRPPALIETSGRTTLGHKETSRERSHTTDYIGSSNDKLHFRHVPNSMIDMLEWRMIHYLPVFNHIFLVSSSLQDTNTITYKIWRQ